MPIDPKPGGTDVLDASGNGKGVDLNSDISDIESVGIIKDSSVGFVDIGGGSAQARAAFIQISSPNSAVNGLFFVMVGAINSIALIWRNNVLMDFDASATPPTGLTGVVGHTLVRACTNGRVYLENRTGASIAAKLLATGIIA